MQQNDKRYLALGLILKNVLVIFRIVPFTYLCLLRYYVRSKLQSYAQSYFFQYTPVLILKYDQCRISTGESVCLYSGPLTSPPKNEVFSCFYLTHSRTYSQIYDPFLL